jgi:hypothetical protein
MPDIPIILPAGAVAVYGPGEQNTRMPSGVLLDTNYRFGTIYNIWDGGATYVYGGDVVYWKEGTQLTRIVTENNLIYTILPARLVTIDNPIIAP